MVGNNKTVIHMPLYHTPNIKQGDYMYSLKSDNSITDRLVKEFNLPVFSYSVFHIIFFEQYLYNFIVNITFLRIHV